MELKAERTIRSFEAPPEARLAVVDRSEEAPTAERLHVDLAGPDYVKLSASDKQQALWQEVSAKPYDTLPELSSAGLLGGGVFQAVGTVAQLLQFNRLKHTFDDASDIRAPRAKLFHPFGVVATAEVVPVASPYRGLLSEKTQGMVRLSLATPERIGFVPGIALKLFQDGKPSQNIVAIHKLSGEPTHDFFTPTLSTTIEKPTSLPVKAIAWLTSFVANPLVRKVAPEIANVNGEAPARLDFVATDAVAHAAPGAADFRSELSAMPVGTPLYQIYAVDKANTRTLVAEVKSTSPFVASAFGDQTYFVQHHR